MHIGIVAIGVSFRRCSVLPCPHWDKMFSMLVKVFVASKMHFDQFATYEFTIDPFVWVRYRV